MFACSLALPHLFKTQLICYLLQENFMVPHPASRPFPYPFIYIWALLFLESLLSSEQYVLCPPHFMSDQPEIYVSVPSPHPTRTS